MAEKTILVCDVDGDEPAVQTVGLRVGGRSLQKDLCQRHLDELLRGAKPARRGRRRGQTVISADGSAPKRRGRPAKTAAKRRGRLLKSASTAKRRGRPRKQRETAATESTSS
jgi:hypothetical protein